MSFSALTVEEAYREAVRRAHRYGGTWVVVPHPDNPKLYAVGLDGIVPGKALKSYRGPSVSELVQHNERRKDR